MTLNEYLRREGALSVSALRLRMVEYGSPIKSDAQIRQWQHRYAGRYPSPLNCVAIEYATGGLVSRKDLRPCDWAAIWPELVMKSVSEPSLEAELAPRATPAVETE